MSYLYRTGNSRNNIAFTNTANSSTRYLRRTNTGRNSIVWTTIPSGSTYNILQRNGTGRNNILWANLKIGPDLSANGLRNNMHITTTSWEYAMTSEISYEDIRIATRDPDSVKVRISSIFDDDIIYESNKITFGDSYFSAGNGGSFYLNNNPNYADFNSYSMIIIFCSQQPPTEYINAISSVIAFISSRSETYSVRAVRYGYMNFQKNAFNNCLAISLNTDSIMTNITTQYSICFS